MKTYRIFFNHPRHGDSMVLVMAPNPDAAFRWVDDYLCRHGEIRSLREATDAERLWYAMEGGAIHDATRALFVRAPRMA